MVVPLSALGVAGNIVQFVDFSCKLIRKSSDIYHSANAENTELDKIGRFLRGFNSDLASSLLSLETHELVLRDLASSCRIVAQELLSTIGQVKGPLSRGKSSCQALKAVWGRDKVHQL